MVHMKYSIIIPIYNAADTLQDCINSIFQTGLDDYEIVLVDDGSTDCSAEICRKLSQTYPQIEYIYQKNSGVSAARNNGIRHALGKYIIFCDADDSFEPDCFLDIDNALTNDVDLLIYGISVDYYHNGLCYRKDELIYPYEGKKNTEKWINDFEAMYDYNVLSPVWNKIYRKDIIIRNGLSFDTKMILLEDFVFSIKYLAYCNDVYFRGEVAYRYRQAEDERNAQNRLDRIPSINNMMRCIRNCLDEADTIIVLRTGSHLKEVDKICYRIYYMLISQKLYYSSCMQMREISKEVLSGSYQDKNKMMKMGMETLKIYSRMERKQFYKIRCYNLYCQFRHFLAVKYKSYFHTRGKR